MLFCPSILQQCAMPDLGIKMEGLGFNLADFCCFDEILAEKQKALLEL